MNEKRFEIKRINVKRDHIFLHHDLLKDPEIEKTLISLNKDIIAALYLPVFFHQTDENYYLVSRHWVYSYFVDNAIFEFSAIIIFDEEIISQVIKIEQVEFALFAKNASLHRLPSRMVSRTTETRHKAIQSGQTCPFCGGPLRQSRSRKKIDGIGYKISCENKARKIINNSKGCDFEAVMTETEIRLFREYQLPTDHWLKLAEGQKCSQCGDAIFLRTVYKEGKQEFYERCRSYYSREKKCTHKKKITGKDA